MRPQRLRQHQVLLSHPPPELELVSSIRHQKFEVRAKILLVWFIWRFAISKISSTKQRASSPEMDRASKVKWKMQKRTMRNSISWTHTIPIMPITCIKSKNLWKVKQRCRGVLIKALHWHPHPWFNHLQQRYRLSLFQPIQSSSASFFRFQRRFKVKCRSFSNRSSLKILPANTNSWLNPLRSLLKSCKYCLYCAITRFSLFSLLGISLN